MSFYIDYGENDTRDTSTGASQQNLNVTPGALIQPNTTYFILATGVSDFDAAGTGKAHVILDEADSGTVRTMEIRHRDAPNELRSVPMLYAFDSGASPGNWDDWSIWHWPVA